MIRLQLAGTSVPSSALARLWRLALSLGVKAPCKPCRGWQRGWGWGRPPQSYKRWPLWTTQTVPSAVHAPWLTGQSPPDLPWSHRTSGDGLQLVPPRSLRPHYVSLKEKKMSGWAQKIQTHAHMPCTYMYYVHTLAYLATVNLLVTWACWVSWWGQLSKDYFPSDRIVTRPR